MELFSQNSLDFTYHDLRNSLELKLNGVLRGICMSMIILERFLLLIQRQAPTLSSFVLGEGMFATSAGETLYTYKCRRTSVQPRTVKGKCYTELPIYVKVPYENTTKEMFLQPYTSLITDIGIEIPCAPQFIPKYEVHDGSWILASPTIVYAQGPEDPPRMLTPVGNVTIPAQEFTNERLYTPQDLHKMRKYLTLAHMKTTLVTKLAQQVDYNAYKGGIIAPEELFPKFDVTSWMKNTLWKFLITWGGTASIFMAIYTIGALFLGLCQVITNCLLLKSNYGMSTMLGWACCMQTYLARKINRYTKEQEETTGHYGPTRPDEEQFAGEKIKSPLPNWKRLRKQLSRMTPSAPMQVSKERTINEIENPLYEAIGTHGNMHRRTDSREVNRIDTCGMFPLGSQDVCGVR